MTRSGVRRGVRYQTFVVDPGFKEDRWVQMAEVLPGNRAVVHHILVHVFPPRGLGQLGVGGGAFLVAFVPGLRAKILPKGMARYIPKASKLVFQVHYTPIGSVQQDLSKVGLVFADAKDVKQVVFTSRATNPRLRIPANDANYRVEATTRSLPFDVKLLSFMPHMHLRGKAFSYAALYSNGIHEMLLNVPEYDFNWQTQYNLAKAKILPAGTRMRCVAHYDNSINNLANPNPKRVVKWGDQTWDEMMIGYFDLVISREKFASLRKKSKLLAEVQRRGVEILAKARLLFDKISESAICP